jgi:hypothetical protein
MIPSPVQQATGRKLAAAIVFRPGRQLFVPLVQKDARLARDANPERD